MYAPVILFTYNRPDTTQKVITALARNPEAKETELFIFSDAPKNENQQENVAAVRKVIETIDNTSFKYVHIKYQAQNKGLAASIIDGVTEVFSRHSRVIVLEDDCVVAPSFLNFMDMALDKYEQDSKIGAISGYTPELKQLPDCDVYAVMRSCSLGWGTWKDVWNNTDFSMKYYSTIRYNCRFIRRFNKCGNDRMYRFIRQKKYNLQSWSIRFGASLAKDGLLTVYPKYSYLENIGLDSGGVHSSNNTPEQMKTRNDRGISNPSLPDKLTEDNQISKEFRTIYGGSFLSQLKRTVYVWGGEKIIDAFRNNK